MLLHRPLQAKLGAQYLWVRRTIFVFMQDTTLSDAFLEGRPQRPTIKKLSQMSLKPSPPRPAPPPRYVCIHARLMEPPPFLHELKPCLLCREAAPKRHLAADLVHYRPFGTPRSLLPISSELKPSSGEAKDSAPLKNSTELKPTARQIRKPAAPPVAKTPVAVGGIKPAGKKRREVDEVMSIEDVLRDDDDNDDEEQNSETRKEKKRGKADDSWTPPLVYSRKNKPAALEPPRAIYTRKQQPPAPQTIVLSDGDDEVPKKQERTCSQAKRIFVLLTQSFLSSRSDCQAPQGRSQSPHTPSKLADRRDDGAGAC